MNDQASVPRSRAARHSSRPAIGLVVLWSMLGGGPLPGAAQTVGDEPGIRVEKTATSWLVTYRLDQAVRTLVFDRPAGFFRERAWSVVTPGYRLERAGDDQVLRVIDDAPPSPEVTVRFDRFTEPLPREYELFVPFDDGAVALYTGHLYARPEHPADTSDAPSMRTLHIIPPPDVATAVSRDTVFRSPFSWTDEAGDGTYVYFGDAEPIETEDMVAVLDAGLPEWIRDQFERGLPRLFAVYRDGFGVSLPTNPLVLYGFEDVDRSGYSSGGGTLTGLIQLTVSGTGWSTRSPVAEEQSFALLAHEAAHMWNGQLVQNRDGLDPWMHEGSADALANHVLRNLEVITPSRQRERAEFALNDCSLRLGTGAVNESRDPRVPYACGQVMAMWTEASLAASGAVTDIVGFWRALIAAARGRDGTYDQALYWSTLATLGVPERTIRRMRGFVSEPNPQGIVGVVQGLREANVRIRDATDVPDRFTGALARRAMVHLMSAACNGRFSFNAGPTFQTDPMADCAPFARAFEVAAIDGLRVNTDGVALYDAVAARCARDESVTLTGPGGTVLTTVTCTDSLADRPAFYELH